MLFSQVKLHLLLPVRRFLSTMSQTKGDQNPVSHEILTNISMVVFLKVVTINPFPVNSSILNPLRRYNLGSLAKNGLRLFFFTTIYASINLKLKHPLRCFSGPWMFFWKCKALIHCLTCETHFGSWQLPKQNVHFLCICLYNIYSEMIALNFFRVIYLTYSEIIL